MTIGEVASVAGVETSTLRYYESIGLLPPPARRGGKRCYAPDILPILAVIKLAKDVNFSLEEIRELLYGQPNETTLADRWRSLAERKLLEVNALIARATEMKHLLEDGLACDALQFELEIVMPNSKDVPKGA
jgi:MerR family redox-sensitive transcriptional activator SoxR